MSQGHYFDPSPAVRDTARGKSICPSETSGCRCTRTPEFFRRERLTGAPGRRLQRWKEAAWHCPKTVTFATWDADTVRSALRWPKCVRKRLCIWLTSIRVPWSWRRGTCAGTALGMYRCGAATASSVFAPQRFDLIITNPPIRAGKAQVHALLTEAKEWLVPGGRLALVIRTQQGAKSLAAFLETLFPVVEEIEKGRRLSRVRGTAHMICARREYTWGNDLTLSPHRHMG